MSLNISLKYILLILSSLLFILISISGMLFPLIKFDFIYQYNLSIYPIEERTSLSIEKIKNTNIQIKDYFFSDEELSNLDEIHIYDTLNLEKCTFLLFGEVMDRA